MRFKPALAALCLLACSSSFETRQVTTVQVVGASNGGVVVASGPEVIPPPRVITPVAEPQFAQPPRGPVTPLVVAGDGGPRLRCPAPSRALAGTPVHLRAEAEGEGVRVRWTVTQSPQARYYRFSERFDANDSDSIVALGLDVPFTSVIVGDYTVVAEARDREGRTAQCETQVTMAGHGLRVELSWNTTNTDVDLHMVTSRDPRWVSPSDCYYANRRPDTAFGDESRQRWLDTDDTDGEGPENIRIDAPDLEAEYQVGVHYYSSHGQSGDTTAIVMIYCGDQRVARFERDLEGQSDPNSNPFWRVASVRFRPDGSCAVAAPRGRAVTPQSVVAGVVTP
jgi:hypothetical protein